MDGIDPHRRLVPYHYLACKYSFPSCPTFRLADFFSYPAISRDYLFRLSHIQNIRLLLLKP